MFFFKKKKKILVVEDERDIAEGIKARLGLDGFKVILASNGEEGVQKARSEKPNLIILDVMMPVLNGFEACKLLKEDDRTREIPILVLTALSQMQDVDRAFELGAKDFLPKPFTNDRLMQKVHTLLSNIPAR